MTFTLDLDLLSDLVALSEEAGRAILDIYESGDFGETAKEDKSPLTKADLAANGVIVDGLRRLTPETPILSEESREIPYSEREGWTRFWLVDPLDGTKEFIKRNGEFTVNIALVEGGRAVAGVVHAPVLGVTYLGAEGFGAFKTGPDGSKSDISASSYTGGEPRIVASRSHRGEILDAFLSSVGAHECISMGSSLKICLVAEGAADLYPRLGPTMEWDTAAAHAVVSAAEGHLTDLEGTELGYNKENLLNPYFIVNGDPAFPWQEHLIDIKIDQGK